MATTVIWFALGLMVIRSARQVKNRNIRRTRAWVGTLGMALATDQGVHMLSEVAQLGTAAWHMRVAPFAELAEVFLPITLFFLSVGLALDVAARGRYKSVDTQLARVDLLQELARRDPMTGLYNKRYFFEAFKRRRSDSEHLPISVLIVDIDNMKTINDTHGHLAGDEAIAAVAKALTQGRNEADVVARFGGDEFAILLSKANDAQAEQVAEQIRLAMQQLSQVTAQVDVSIGSFTCNTLIDCGFDIDPLQQADQRLYQEKQLKQRTIVG